jgi:hypothetical protein
MSELIHPTEVIEEPSDWENGTDAIDDFYSTWAGVTNRDTNPSARMILGLGGFKNIDAVLAHLSSGDTQKFYKFYVDVYVDNQWIEAGVATWPCIGNNLIEFGQIYNTDRIGVRARLIEPPNEDYLNDIKVRVVSDVKVRPLVNQTLASSNRKGLV